MSDFHYLVTTLIDDGSTQANGATSGSLRQGILNEDANGGGVITLANTLSGSLALTGTLPSITQPITVDGSQSSAVTISGSTPIVAVGGAFDWLNVTTGTTTVSSGTTLTGSFFSSPIVDDGAIVAENTSFLSTGLIGGNGGVSLSFSSDYIATHSASASASWSINAAPGTATFSGNVIWPDLQFASTSSSGLLKSGTGTQIFTGALSGSAHTPVNIQVNAGTLDIHAATLSNIGTISFTNSTGTATLVASAAQLAQTGLNNFGQGSTLDLSDATFGIDSVVYDSAAGALKVMSGATVLDTIHLGGSSHVGTLNVVSDGSNGSIVTETPSFLVTSLVDDSSTAANGAISGSLKQGILNEEAAGGGTVTLASTLSGSSGSISASLTIDQSITLEGIQFNTPVTVTGSTSIAANGTLTLSDWLGTFGPIVDNGHLVGVGNTFIDCNPISGNGDISLSSGLDIADFVSGSQSATFTGNLALSFLDIFGSVTQVLTGNISSSTSGLASIDVTGGTLDLHSASLSNIGAIFLSGNGTLVASAAQLAQTGLAQLIPGTTLDLSDVTFGTDNVVYDSTAQALKIMSGATVLDTIHLSTPIAGTLTLADDGHGGTAITETSTSTPTSTFTYQVTTLADDNSTSANSATSGSLRQGILNADANGGGSIVVDGSLTGSIALTNPLPTITQSTTISGGFFNSNTATVTGLTSIASGATLTANFFTPFLGAVTDNGHLILDLGFTGGGASTGLISGSGDIDAYVFSINMAGGTSTFTGNVSLGGGASSITGGLFVSGTGTEILTGSITDRTSSFGSTSYQPAILIRSGALDIHAATLIGVNTLGFDNTTGNATLVASAAQLAQTGLVGFGQGSTLDLRDVSFSADTVVYDDVARTMTVKAGSTVLETIHLSGFPLGAASLQAVSDGQGGTALTETWTPSTSTIAVSGGAASVAGTAGDDTITATAGILNALTSIDGGAGINTLALTGPGSFDLSQPAVLTNIQKIVMTGSGPDSVTLRGGLDVAFGASNLGDTVTGGNAHDTIFGGTGADSLIAGGSGTWLIGNGGTDTLIASSAGGDTLLGSAGNDRLVSNSTAATANFLIGKEGSGTGNDTLIGGAGHDTLVGHNGNDSIVGGNGGNFLIGGYPGSLGNPTLVGGTGDDTIVAAPGASSLSAGGGNDFLVGEGGNDTIVAGTGSDTIFGHGGLGGSDANVYVVAPGETVLIADFANTDRIDISAYHFATFTALQAAATITGADNGVIVVLSGGLTLSIVGETTIHSSDFLL